jgi:hypothetical protein
MPKQKKLKLNELKVNSFVTVSMSNDEARNVKGGMLNITDCCTMPTGCTDCTICYPCVFTMEPTCFCGPTIPPCPGDPDRV